RGEPLPPGSAQGRDRGCPARVPAPSRCRARPRQMTAAPVIRPLAYSDLPQVNAIERRAFPTPWSLAMFVLELSKPSGVCLAAVTQRRLAGYLICSRYDSVWHVMNLAVDADQQRNGLATVLLAELYRRVDDAHARFTLEVRRSN